ncbi:integral membrane protein GPR137 [Sceloporus undulatus]|uniref:integral membrane protein GPR137 n=1 Tax=Sceloporus undulatus TaxID=8520 RepID=UPI001C4DC1B3|nr:integral membrane protein GPR137 [Sceloporus undulatus]
MPISGKKRPHVDTKPGGPLPLPYNSHLPACNNSEKKRPPTVTLNGRPVPPPRTPSPSMQTGKSAPPSPPRPLNCEFHSHSQNSISQHLQRAEKAPPRTLNGVLYTSQNSISPACKAGKSAPQPFVTLKRSPVPSPRTPISQHAKESFLQYPTPFFPPFLRLVVRGACLGASILFLAVNVACAVLVRARRAEPWAVVLARVLISDSLFVLGAVSLALCLCLVARGSPSTRIYLEAKGTTLCQTAAMGGTIVLLYASRACYNLVALALSSRTRLDSFDYDWYNVSDQADLITDLGDQGYVVFGLILFVWELLPTTLLVGFFRVHRPAQDMSASRVFNRQLGVSRSYFFDHLGQRDSEGLTSSLTGRLASGSWYGSINRSGDQDWFGGHPPTAPLLFSQAAAPGGHHHSLYSTPQN